MYTLGKTIRADLLNLICLRRVANMNDICIKYKMFWSEKRATLEKPICVKVVQCVYRASASKSLCNMLEDYKVLSLITDSDNRFKLSDPLVHEKDFASWSKIVLKISNNGKIYRGADKSLARSTFRCILFDGENITLMLVLLYINSTNIPPIMIIDKIYENQNLLSLLRVSFLVGLRT